MSATTQPLKTSPIFVSAAADTIKTKTVQPANNAPDSARAVRAPKAATSVSQAQRETPN